VRPPPPSRRYTLLSNLEDKSLRDCANLVNLKAVAQVVTGVTTHCGEDPSGAAILQALSQQPKPPSATATGSKKKRPIIAVSPKCKVWVTAEAMQQHTLAELLASPSPKAPLAKKKKVITIAAPSAKEKASQHAITHAPSLSLRAGSPLPSAPDITIYGHITLDSTPW